MDPKAITQLGLTVLVVVAALAFAWVGKMDVAVGFGIAGTAVGLATPSALARQAVP